MAGTWLVSVTGEFEKKTKQVIEEQPEERLEFMWQVGKYQQGGRLQRWGGVELPGEQSLLGLQGEVGCLGGHPGSV